MSVSKSEKNDKISTVLSILGVDAKYKKDRFYILKEIVKNEGITVEEDIRGEYRKTTKNLEFLKEKDLIERYKDNLVGRGRQNMKVAESTPQGELVVKYINQLGDEIESAPQSINDVDKREIREKFNDIKEAQKKFKNTEGTNGETVIRDHLDDLKEYIASENNPRAYLVALENEELIEYLHDQVKDVKSDLDVSFQNYHYLDLYFTIWEKTALNSDYNAKKDVEKNLDKVWDAITLAQRLLVLGQPSQKRIKKMEKQPPDLKKKQQNIREKPRKVIKGFFNGYFQQEPIGEKRLSDVIEWYEEECREEPQIIEGYPDTKEGFWERILLNLEHEEDKRCVKKQLKDGKVSGDVGDNIIETKQYYILDEDEDDREETEEDTDEKSD